MPPIFSSAPSAAPQLQRLLSAFVRAALSPLLLPALPGDDRMVRHVAAEDIERAADTEIDAAAPALFHVVEVGQRARAAGIRYRDGRPLAQPLDQRGVDAQPPPFYVDPVNEKLIARIRQPCKRLARDRCLG